MMETNLENTLSLGSCCVGQIESSYFNWPPLGFLLKAIPAGPCFLLLPMHQSKVAEY